MAHGYGPLSHPALLQFPSPTNNVAPLTCLLLCCHLCLYIFIVLRDIFLTISSGFSHLIFFFFPLHFHNEIKGKVVLRKADLEEVKNKIDNRKSMQGKAEKMGKEVWLEKESRMCPQRSGNCGHDCGVNEQPDGGEVFPPRYGGIDFELRE